MKAALVEFLDHLRLNENASPHTVRAYDSDLSQFLTFLAARVSRTRAELTMADFDHLNIREFLGDLHRRGNTRSSVGAEAGRDPHLRPLPAPRGHPRGRSGGARRHTEARAASAGAPGRSGDVDAARDARRLAAARPTRPRDPRALLRVRPPAERARGARSRRREPERPDGARARQGGEGADRAVQPLHGGGAARLAARPRVVRGR